MKKILAFLIAVTIVLSGCGGTQNSGRAQNIGVDIENGVFEITPQEFIDGFNNSVKQFQKSSKDKKTEYLILFPDFVESDKDIEMDDGLNVTYISGADDKLQEIVLMYYPGWPSNEATMTFAFLLGSLPAYFTPGSSLNLNDEFNLDSINDFGSVMEGDVEYSFVTVSGGIRISVKAVHLEKKNK